MRPLLEMGPGQRILCPLPRKTDSSCYLDAPDERGAVLISHVIDRKRFNANKSRPTIKKTANWPKNMWQKTADLTKIGSMRRLLLEQLIRWSEKKDRKPLILKGTRQVGKTTLLHQFGEKRFSAVHALNFEKDLGLDKIFGSNLDPKQIVKELEFYFQRNIDLKRDLLIFDEIQAYPRALTSLKYFAEELPQLAVASAGSLLGVYLGPASFPVGKVDMITLYPMSFEEFLLALEDHRSLELLRKVNLHESFPEMAHRHLFEQIKHYFIVGGLPEAVKTFR